MKKFAIFILLIGVFFQQTSLADGKSKQIEFGRDVVINGKEIKKGKYKVQFTDETSEVTISKGSKIITKSKARKVFKKDGNKAINTQILIVKQDEKNVIKRITLEGETEDILFDIKPINATPQ
jgi:hypothetical protein